MKHDIIPFLGYSRLTEMCIFWANNNIDPFAGITAAARATNNIDMIRDLLSYSVKIARRHAKTTASLALQMNLGLLLFREYDDEPNSGARFSRILASQNQAALHIECATRPPKSSAASTRTELSSPHPTRLNSRQRSRDLKTSSRCSTRRISGAARWAKTQKNGVTAPHKPSCSH